MRNSTELLGVTSVITGAAGLLGSEHAIALLSLGSTVALWDVDEDLLFKAADRLKIQFPESKIVAQVVNITQESEVRNALVKLLDQKLSPGILVNNAAVNHKPSQLKDSESRAENYNLELWKSEIDVGLTGTFICSKILGSYFLKHNKGSIINISSDLSVISPDNRIYEKQNLSPIDQPMKPVSYSVIKTGIIGLTRYLATSWATFNIRVNAISPGGVFDNQDPIFTSRVQERIPLGRMATKYEYRAAIQFLATDDSSYMTGQNLIIDGGRSAW